MDEYETKLVAGWEDVHRKGQLSLWILLALKDGAKHMAQIKEFIERLSSKTITADDKSMYRSLRRFSEAEMISFVTVPTEGAPDRKVYSLTQIGKNVLQEFIERNIKLFYNKEIREILGTNHGTIN